MNTIIPMIVPMYRSAPSRCPSCDKTEKKKVVCAHCGHEYKDSESEGLSIGQFALLAIVCAVAFIWLFLTVAAWLVSYADIQPHSLFEILKSQAEFVGKLRVW
jgi:uncharacterized protein (DUF983 family)